jgi:hypothetical protein
MKTFEKIYKTTVEPMLTYAIETWYPSQVVLQNTIERAQKFAAKLFINDFTSSYLALLEKLQWKLVNQVAMKKHALTMHKSSLGYRKLPVRAVMLCKDHNRRRTKRTGHELELIIPVSTLEVVTSSSLNIAKKT